MRTEKITLHWHEMSKAGGLKAMKVTLPLEILLDFAESIGARKEAVSRKRKQSSTQDIPSGV